GAAPAQAENVSASTPYTALVIVPRGGRRLKPAVGARRGSPRSPPARAGPGRRPSPARSDFGAVRPPAAASVGGHPAARWRASWGSVGRGTSPPWWYTHRPRRRGESRGAARYRAATWRRGPTETRQGVPGGDGGEATDDERGPALEARGGRRAGAGDPPVDARPLGRPGAAVRRARRRRRLLVHVVARDRRRVRATGGRGQPAGVRG